MLHVLQGTTSDSDEITRLIDEGGGDGFVTPWVVPKNARPGDDILIYYRHTGSIIERGEIVSIPEPALFGKRHVYRANIKIGQWLDLGITLDELSALFPEWAWLRYPRPTQHQRMILLRDSKFYSWNELNLMLKKKCQRMIRSTSTMMYLDLFKIATRQDKRV